jgi:transposase
VALRVGGDAALPALPRRWVVERTLAWLNRYRRLRVRYERRDDGHQAFLDLGSALVCWGYVQRFC